MITKNHGVRIIETRPGPGTAETLYLTEDGRCWSHNMGLPAIRWDRTTTGSGVGRIVGNRIIEEP